MATTGINNHSTSQPKWLILLRISLGFILFWKGISFIHDSSELEKMVHSTGIGLFDTNLQTIALIISYANLLGGFLIAVGLRTRVVAIIQIPIVIGAIIFVNIKAGMSLSNGELILSIIVLLLLILFIIAGSGVISADEYFRSYYKAGSEPGYTKKFFQ